MNGRRVVRKVHSGMSVAGDLHPEMTVEPNRTLPMNRVEFLQTVDSLISSTARAPGLSTLNCFEDVGKENTFLWRECWRSQAEIEVRLQTGEIKTLMGAIGVLGELDRLQILTAGRQKESTPGWA